MHRTFTPTSSNPRVFIACLLSFMILIAPMASVAAVTSGNSRPVASPAKASPVAETPLAEISTSDPGPVPSSIVNNATTAQPLALAVNNATSTQPLAPLAPSITATLADSFPVHPSTKANPGDVINYTAIVGNGGPDDALNVNFGGTLDLNTTLVPGSIHASPIAFNDTYAWVGNTTLDTSARSLPSITANDVAITDGFTLAPFSGPTTLGGSVNVSANGHFVYTPEAGDTGADTFTYTIINSADGSLSGTGTVTINLNGRVWYVQNQAVNGTGTQASPFNSPSAASVAANQATDIIYVLSDLANPLLNGNFALDDGQQLLGQGVDLVVSAITIVAAGSAPTTTNTGGNGITLNSAGVTGTNTVRGLNVGDTSGIDINGTNFGTLTLNTVTLNGTGRPLDLNTGAVTATFASITATSASGGPAINLTGITGSLTVTGGTSITHTGTQGIFVGTSTANMNFGSTTTTSGGSNGVSLNNNGGGTRTFGSLSITNATAVAFLHTAAGGTTNITGLTTITNPGSSGIDIQDSTTAVTFANTIVTQSTGTGVELGGTGDGNSGAVTFADLDISPDPGARAFFAVDNTGTITTTSGTITNTSAAANTVQIDGPVGRTPLAMVLDSVSSDGAGNGMIIMDVSGSFVTGSVNLQNNADIGLLVSGSIANLNFGNTTVNSSAGDAVDISNTIGVSFAALNLTPDLGLRGLDASSNSGSISASSGTIATTDAVAVNVSATPLSMTLTSVSADNDGAAHSCVSLTSATGSLTMQGGTLIGGTASAFLVSGGTVSTTFSGSITQTNNAAMVDIANHTTGTITFNTGTLNATGGTGLQFNNADSTTSYNFNGTTTLNGGDAGVDITGGSAGTFNFGTTSINNPSGIAYREDTSTANVTWGGTITKTNNANQAVDINAKSGGTTAFSALINASTTTANAIDLTNTGGIMNFTGGVTLTTTSGVSFNATGGGTITVTGASNTLSSTTGSALNVVNTNIGLAGLTFLSINSTGIGTNGIVLNSTGTTAGTHGGLTVTGTSTTAGTGGAIQNKDEGAKFTSTRNLTLKNMNFTNANTGDAGDVGQCDNTDAIFNLNCKGAIDMESVTVATFDNLFVDRTLPTGGEEVGINGRTVSDLTITNTTVQNYGDSANEAEMRLFNLTGTCLFNNSAFKFSPVRNVEIRNNTGVLNLTITSPNTHATTNSIFSDTQSSGIGADGLEIQAFGTSDMNIAITNSKFLRNRTNGLQVLVRGDADVNVDVSNRVSTATPGNTFDREVGIGVGINLTADNTSTLNFNIINNPLINSRGGSVINVQGDRTAAFQGRINSNTLTAGGAATSGSGINIVAQGDSQGRVEILSNTINGIGFDTGIRFLSRLGADALDNSRLDVTAVSNSITLVQPAPAGSSYGIAALAGSATAGETNTTCADLRSNTVTLAPGAAFIAAFQSRETIATANLLLEGFSGTATNTWNINLNTPAGSVDETGTASAGTCLNPAHAAPLALFTPLTTPREDLAQTQISDTAAPGNKPSVLAYSVTVGISAETMIPASQVAAFNEVLAPVTAVESTVIESNATVKSAVVDQRNAVVAETNLKDGNSTLTSLLGSLSDRTNKRNNVRSHHATIRRAAAQPATVAAGNSMATLAPLSGENVPVAIGTLPAGKSVTIKFAATITATPNADTVSLQGTVSGSNFGSVLTDDPSVGGATDITVTPIALPDLTIQKTHTGDFQQGQTSKTYTITPSNSGEFSTFGTITVTDTLPAGLTPTAPNAAHNGWTCSIVGQLLTCTRNDVHAVGPLPTITLTVDVANNAPASVTNTAAVSGGGQQNTANDTDDDLTNINVAPDLSILKTHVGDFTQGQVGAQYTIAVTNNGPGAVLAGDTITVTDTLPAGLTPTAPNGAHNGWTCSIVGQLLTCTRSDTQPVGALPTITLEVTVAANATDVTNTAVVSGGGDVTAGNNSDGDPTTVLVLAAQANDDSYVATKDTPLNVAAPGVLANDTGNPTPTAVPISNGPTTAGGTVTLNADGSFLYTPLAGYTGPDSFTYTATNTNGSDSGTVNISVGDPIFLNEVLFNPDATGNNEYIELRGTPSATIPAGTYLVAIDGDTGNNGDVTTIINLSGLSFGTNGFLVLLQEGNTYTTTAGATVITSTTTGFGGLPGAIWQSDGGATSLEDDSVTFMVIQTLTAPTLLDDIDSNDDATADGGIFAGWTVRDSIGSLDGNATDTGYGARNFVMGGGGLTPAGTAAVVGFVPLYVGRNGNSTGSASIDWVATGALGGAAPNWNLGSNPEPPGYANKPLDHIGSINFANVAPVNTVPGAQSTDEDTPFIFTGPTQISIADADAGTAQVKVTLTAQNGTFSLSGTAGLTFTPPGAGNDGTNDTQMIFTGTITNINNALNNLTFTPTLHFFSPPDASLTILTDDLGNSGSDGAKTDSDTINITVGGINDAPTLDAIGNLTIAEDATTQTVNLSGITAGAAEVQTLAVTSGSNNTGLIPNPSVTYTSPSTTGSISFAPVADQNGGPVTITVTVMDNGGVVGGGVDTFQRQFDVTVTEVNDAPVAGDDVLTDVDEDSAARTIPFATLLLNDTKGAANEGVQTLNITAVSNPVGGTVQIVGTDVIFTPAANFNGAASFDYTLQDDGTTNGAADPKTDTGAVSFNLTAVNDPPSFTIAANPPAVNEDAGAQTVNSFATSISQGPGESGQTLTFNITPGATTSNIAFSSGPAIDETTGNLTYTVSPDTNGTAIFNVTLSDNGGGTNTSGSQPFTITVNAVNDAPSFQILSAPPAVGEDAGAQTVNSFATNFQPGPVTATDETGQTLVGYTVTQTSSTGNLAFTSGPVIDNAGTLTYTPTNNTSGTVTFNAVATDSGSGVLPNVNQSAAVAFTITVNGQNDAPVLDNTGNMSLTAINEDVANASNPGTLVSDIIASAGGDRITDVDAGAIEGIAVIAVDNTNGAWEFSINNGTNWTPFGTPDTLNSRLLASNATTRVRFIPNANFNGTIDPGITFRAWDQSAGTNGTTADTTTTGTTTAFSTATETASIVVNPVNDQPTANAQLVSTNEETPLPITLTGSDVETAAGSLTFTVTVQPTSGVLTGSGANRTYTPNANFTGADSFKFTVTDTGDGASPALTSAEATVSITVNAVNDGPVNTVPAATQTVIKNGTLTFNAANSNLVSIADIDAGASAVQVTLATTNGTTTLSGTAGLAFTTGDGTADATMTFTGTLANINAALNGMSFTPTLNFDGAASIQITTNDQGNTGTGGALSDTDTININVIPGGTLAFNSNTYTVAEDGVNATITVLRSGGTTGEARVDYATSNGTASFGSDYTTTTGTLIFPDGVTSQTFNVPIINDTADESNETVNLALSNATGTGGLGTPIAAVLTITDNDPPSFQLDASTYSVGEGDLRVSVTVTRAGDLSQAIRVDYATSDMSGLNACSQITGHASQRCDYATVVGTLRFGIGENSKVINIPIVDDVYIEGAEIFTLTLNNNSGGDLGTPVTATITINDNDVGPAANPIDNDAFWIRQMYIDVLGREPEPGAVAAWLAILNNCVVSTDCDREAVALGFLQSEEFQIRGFFVYRFYAASLGRPPVYPEFVPDHARMSGFLSPADLELNKTAYVDEFMNRTEFKNIYDPTIGNNTAYVDTLLARAGIPAHPKRTDWINGLNGSTLTRAQVLRELVDSNEVYGKFVNEAFVVMNYFGLLRRTADAQYLVWITVLDQFGHRAVVGGFINSPEYRLRFGP